MVRVVEGVHDLVVFGLGFELVDEALWEVGVHVGAGLGWLRLLGSGESRRNVGLVWADGLGFSIAVSTWRILGGRVDSALGLDVVLGGLLLLRPSLRWLLVLNVANFIVGESLLLNGACALLLIRDSVLLLSVDGRSIVRAISRRVGSPAILDRRWLSHQEVFFPLDLVFLRFTLAEIKVLGRLFALAVLR